jgi:predicted nucleotidyltransferase
MSEQRDILPKVQAILLQQNLDCTVYLAGSVSSGDERPDSDMDLVVLVPDADRGTFPGGRVRDRKADFKFVDASFEGVPLEIIFMTPAAFEQLLVAKPWRGYKFLEMEILHDPQKIIASCKARIRPWFQDHPEAVTLWKRWLAEHRDRQLSRGQKMGEIISRFPDMMTDLWPYLDVQFGASHAALEYRTVRMADLRIDYTSEDDPFVQETCRALRAALKFLCEYFGLKEAFPPVRVILTPNRPEFDRCVREVLRLEIEVPSLPSRIAQPQRTDLIVLSPRVWEKEYNTYSPEDYRRLIAHEATHIVEEYLSPNCEAVRRWWSEGLAMHLSDHWRDSPELEEVRRCVVANQVPALAEIDVAPDGAGPLPRKAVKDAYVWGWTLVKFMETCHGRETIRQVVSACSDGDVFRAAAIDRPRFEQEWKQWLMAGMWVQSEEKPG